MNAAVEKPVLQTIGNAWCRTWGQLSEVLRKYFCQYMQGQQRQIHEVHEALCERSDSAWEELLLL